MSPLRIVMEFMAGGSLENFLRMELKEGAMATISKDPQWGLRIRLALDIARGVHALHSHHPPIIHRDLNSRNILVTKNNF